MDSWLSSKETVQEVVQEGVTIAGSQAAGMLEKGDWQYSTVEVGARLGDTAISSALTFGLMNVPGGVGNVSAGLRKSNVVPNRTETITRQVPERNEEELSPEAAASFLHGLLGDGRNGAEATAVTDQNVILGFQDVQAQFRPTVTGVETASLVFEPEADYTKTRRENLIYDGETVYLRHRSQRDGSANPGRQLSRVEEGAGRAKSRYTESGSADRSAAALTYGKEKISARSLGITGGTERLNVHIVTGVDTEHTRAAKRMAQERGLELVLFTGGNLDIEKGGVAASARAYIEGNRVFVRADHPVYTADQLMRHESGHDMIAKGEVDPNAVRERIGVERAEQVSRMYSEAYAGAGMTPEEIWEEIICDCLADMNIFTGVREAVSEFGQTKSAGETAADTQTQQSRGPPEREGKMSRELKWHPDLTKSQLKRLLQWVKYDIQTSANSICDTANWTFCKFDGLAVFAIYSTENESDPTILYEVKGTQAELERDYLKDILEEFDHGESVNGKSIAIDEVLGRSWMRKAGGHPNDNGTVVRGGGSGNVGVLRKQSRRNTRTAFESVLRNLLRNRENGVNGENSQDFTIPTVADPVMTSDDQESIRADIQEELNQTNKKRSGRTKSEGEFFYEQNSPLESSVEVDSEAFLLGLDNAYSRLDFQNIKSGAQENQAVDAEEGIAATENADITISGARITDPFSEEADEFAEMYYEEIRHFSTDVQRIAKNLSKNEEDIRRIKAYLFEDEVLFDEYTCTWRRFDPDCAIAQSWQRLMLGKNIKPHDRTLIEHELLEMDIKRNNPGISHSEAHEQAAKKYNYSKEVKAYYGSLKKYYTDGK